MEALGRGLMVEPVLERIIAPGRLLARSGRGRETERWLPKMMTGEAQIAVAHFEQDAGYELSHVRTMSRSEGSAWHLDGEKTVVFGGGGADRFIVSARERGELSDPEGIGFYWVACDAEGLETVPFRMVDGSWACMLILRGVAAEKLEFGFEALAQAADDVRIAGCSEMLGIMSTLFEATLEHVRTRKQFGVALGTFQVIQHRLADMYVHLEQARSMLYRAALSAEDARATAIAGMKTYISTAAVELGEQCIHLHGGMGITDELSIGHGHKRLLLLATLFGDADAELQRFVRLNS